MKIKKSTIHIILGLVLFYLFFIIHVVISLRVDPNYYWDSILPIVLFFMMNSLNFSLYKITNNLDSKLKPLKLFILFFMACSFIGTVISIGYFVLHLLFKI